MANPYQDLFNRVNTAMLPGSTSMNVTGPGTSWSSFGGGPMPSVAEGANFTKFGDSGMSYGTPYFLANDFIHQQYVIRPWDDKAHLNISPFQVVFSARQLDFDYNLYSQVSLAKVNEMLARARDVYDAAVAADDRSAIDFQRYMAKYGEPMLELYHRIQKGDAYARNILKTADAETQTDLAAFYRMHSQPVFKYLTKLGIMLSWNVIGICVNANRATGVEAADDMTSEEHVTVLANVVGKRAVTHNIFADNIELPTGSDVYLVLRRVQLRGDRGPGRFEFTPFGTRTRIRPPRSLSVYQDDGDRLIDSHIIPLGVVTQPAGRDAPLGLRQLSAGLTGNNRSAFEAIGSLPTIHVQVGM